LGALQPLLNAGGEVVRRGRRQQKKNRPAGPCGGPRM